MSHISRRMAGFSRARSGATAIEFAIVAPLFFFVIGVIIEMGVMLTTEYTLQKAVEDAGRTLRTGGAAMTGPGFRNEICGNGVAINDCAARIGIVVASAPTFGGITPPGIATINPGQTTFAPGNPNEAVVVIATFDWDFVFPFMAPLGNLPAGNIRRLHGMAVFRNEPL